jgi:glycosyltransferase involved in cell wall biosynthesis
MKIALIGPGIMSIPPDNWGAVESLIWDQYEYLKDIGISIDIINNPNLKEVADQVNTINYDFVHLQYDDHARILNKLIDKPFCTTTHYGYIKEQYPNYYGWKHIFDGVMESKGIIALSPEIELLFKDAGYKNFIKTLRNGARTNNFRFSTYAPKDGLCLGKVEPRKRQADLSKLCENKCNIDFIGPVIDYNFRENNTCKYGGVWNKPSLYQNMTEYKCLVLLSDGEAAPLVVPEALSAGLSVVVSKTAAANLDTSLPFIHVLENGLDEHSSEIISKAIEDNVKYREQIRKYAVKYFDWSVICKEYLEIVKEFINENSLCNNSNK